VTRLRGEQKDEPRIRHIPGSFSDGSGFSDHYITKDKSLPTAGQWMVDTYPRGDNRRPLTDPFHSAPHVAVRVWDGTEWQERSVAYIGKGTQEL